MPDLTEPQIQHTENIIVGSGIAGVTLAHRFESASRDYIVLEKSRGVGGRMATRRFDLSTFDRGAQFFKIRDDQQNIWEQFVGSRLTKLWFQENQTSYYCVKSGMTQAAKTLINKDRLRLNEKVLRLEEIKKTETNLEEKTKYKIKTEASAKENAKYKVITESGENYLCQNIYLTCPLPQSLQILKDSQISYDINLDQIQYAKALVGLFEIHTKSQLIQNFNYAENLTGDIFSLSNQFNKGSSQSLAFTVTMQSDFSETHFDQNDAINLEFVAKSFIHFLKSLDPDNDFFITKSELKKWRYSHPITVYPKPFYEVAHSSSVENSICLIGDAFIRSSLIGSIQSALAVPVN